MEKRIVNNYGSFDVIFVSGKGATLTDVSGRQYIDFVSGIGVNCLGHGHAKLVRAVQEQAAKQIHISNYYLSDVGLEFARKLLELTQFEGCFFCNSGAEANEAAIKLARKYGYLNGGAERKTIVTLQKSFHGRTIETLTATGQDKFHPECFAPYPATFRYIPANDYAAIKTAFDGSVCALMIECVQGEGGVNLIEPEWAKAAAEAARASGVIVIADEVQTGVGRTGTYLASEQLGFNPEVVTLAKGIAGGVPMGACLFRGKAAGVFVAGDHQSTFGGNPLACAAGLAVIDVLTEPGFLDEVCAKGEHIRSAVRGWNLPCIRDVRGKGLMIGIDIAQSAAEVQKRCLANGLCTSTAGANTLRFLPPLVITQNEIDAGLSVLKSVLTA